MLKLPENLRAELAKPHGKLYRGSGVELLKKIDEAKECTILSCVGDLVSIYALEAKLDPKMIIVDGKTVREDIGFDRLESLTSTYIGLKTYNPAGYITCNLVKTLKKAVEIAKTNKKVKVIVEGEEDLAVLPLGLLLPNTSLILYGQPGEGVVAVQINKEKKLLILSFMRRMEKVGDCEEIDALIGGE